MTGAKRLARGLAPHGLLMVVGPQVSGQLQNQAAVCPLAAKAKESGPNNLTFARTDVARYGQ